MAYDSLIEHNARRAYERGRLRYAMMGSLPVALLSSIAVSFGSHRTLDFATGLAVIVLGIFYLYRGKLAGRALFPGVTAGTIPLVLALLANGSHSGCPHHETVSLCLVACITGGIVSSLLIVRFARREAHHISAWGLSTLPTLLVGSLGCGCLGYSGVIALVGALLISSAPPMVRWVTQKA